MKKRNLTFAIFAMAVATIVSAAFVSCKKDSATELAKTKDIAAKVFNPNQIEDMNAYLKDFKLRMQSATKDNDETLSVEEAAWHLSSIANYDFGCANVECDDVRFDTLYSQVTITEGNILLSDLALVYDIISQNIVKLYHSLTLENKHFRFINTFVSDDGKITVSLLTTFTHSSKYLNDTCWYYDNEWYAYDSCYYYFNLSSYPVQTTGTTELQRVLNLVVSHPINNVIGNVYYTLSSTKSFYYRDYIDPFGSPSYLNSRLFASNSCSNCDIGNNICYYFDSYLGLGHKYIPLDRVILSWSLDYIDYEPPMQGEHLSKSFHKLNVNYGRIHVLGSVPGPDPSE